MGKPLNQAQGALSYAVPPAGDIAHAVLQGSITAVGPQPWVQLQGIPNLSVWASVNTALTTTAGSLTASVVSGAGLAAGVAVNSTLVPYGTTWASFSGTSGTLALPTLSYRGAIDQSGVISGLGSTAWLAVGQTVTTPAVIGGPTLPSGTTVVAIVRAASASVTGIVQLSAAPTANSVHGHPYVFSFAINATSIAAGTDSAATFTGSSVQFVGSVQLERTFDGGQTAIVCNVGAAGSLAQWTAGTPVSVSWTEAERGVGYRVNCTAYTSGTINYRLSQTAGAAMSLTTGGVAN